MKIEARELRIGNLVGINNTALHADGCNTENAYFEIEELRRDIVQFKGFHAGEYYKNIEPIPLTEEWLIDLEFKKKVLGDNLGYYYTLDLNDEKHCDLSIFSGDRNEFVEVALFPYEDFFRYKYVHELQNLYYTLTGQELVRQSDC